MTHPLQTRAHLEALLIALTLLNPALADDVDETRLSPAAAELLAFAVTENATARASLGLGVEDGYQARLADRVSRLTMPDLLFYPAATVVGLVNALPVLGVATSAARAA